MKSFTPNTGGKSMCRQAYDIIWNPASVDVFTYDMFMSELLKMNTRKTDTSTTYAYSDNEKQVLGVGQVGNKYFLVIDHVPSTEEYGKMEDTDITGVKLGNGIVKAIADAQASKWNAVVDLVSEHKKKAIGVGAAVAAAALGAGAFAAYKNRDRVMRRLRGTANDVADVTDTLDEARDAILRDDRDQALGKLERAQSILADVGAATGLGEKGEEGESSDYEEEEEEEEEDDKDEYEDETGMEYEVA